MSGKVYLVGAGPGDPELLTLKALRLLGTADVVLHDDLVAPEVLALIPPTAQVYSVGKRCGRKSITQGELNALLVARASDGLTVVRLKGGDPLIFGRAGEEMDALREAGIDFEVVPGVTAASGSAASARVALTDRRLASKLIFLTVRHGGGKTSRDWQGIVSPDATLVFYMPGNDYSGLVTELSAAGWSGRTPCVIVSRAATPQEQIHRTTLEKLPQAPHLPAPALLIVGAVTAAHRHRKHDSDESDGRRTARIHLRVLRSRDGRGQQAHAALRHSTTGNQMGHLAD
jgi:uroporphyrin-III C-methyltransferase